MSGASRSDVVAVVLAAGGGTRYDGPTHKLLAVVPPTQNRPSETVAARAIAIAREASIGPVVVVTGRITRSELALGLPDDAGNPDAPALADRSEPPDPPDCPEPPDPPDISFVDNPRWADGQMTSVQVGIEAARRLGARRVVIGLADQPGITPTAWRDVAATVAEIAVATYDGRRGNPVALESDIWPLLPAEGDEGARTIMRLRPELVVEVACSGSSQDIDTTEDLRRWQNNSSTNSP